MTWKPEDEEQQERDALRAAAAAREAEHMQADGRRRTRRSLWTMGAGVATAVASYGYNQQLSDAAGSVLPGDVAPSAETIKTAGEVVGLGVDGIGTLGFVSGLTTLCAARRIRDAMRTAEGVEAEPDDERSL